MAYPASRTPEGQKTNDNLRQQYNEYLIRTQSGGEPSVSYEDWLRQSQGERIQDGVKKYW